MKSAQFWKAWLLKHEDAQIERCMNAHGEFLKRYEIVTLAHSKAAYRMGLNPAVRIVHGRINSSTFNQLYPDLAATSYETWMIDNIA